MVDAVVSMVLEKLSSLLANPEVVRDLNVHREVEYLLHNLEDIQSVLVDAEQEQNRNYAVSRWLDDLKHVCYDLEDVLEEWNTARLKGVDESAAVRPLKKVGSFHSASCFGFKLSFRPRDTVLKLKGFNKILDDIATQKSYFSFQQDTISTRLEKQLRVPRASLIDESVVYGRHREKNFIVSKLFSDGSENQKGLHIISVVGMGGIGKTTLAQLCYNNDTVKEHFDTRIWVWVSEDFNGLRLAKSIIEALEGSVPNSLGYESLLQYISKSIVVKKFFLVLDDVWNENYSKWEPLLDCLKNGLHGSKILVTTRSESVAQMMQSTDILTVGLLSDQDNWSLFCGIAFAGRSRAECEQLEDIGKMLVKKCHELPLATKTIASLLRFRKNRQEWKQILDSEMWEYDSNTDILPTLSLSYNYLPSLVKRCFLYCAIFPKDFLFETDRLIKLWMAQSYLGMDEEGDMEIIGREYFDILAARAFFQDFEKDDNGVIVRCRMHDLIHDLAQSVAKDECFTMEVSDGLQERITISRSHHMMLALNKGVSFPILLYRATNIVRSLFIQFEVTNCSSVSEVLPKLLSQLTFLRVLDLSGELWFEDVIVKIPMEIGNLVLCRYLNFSFLKIIELPEELCELFNLQTLEISWCTNLKKLPEGMGKLIKLRHFVNVETSITYMPRGFERLTNLRTLSEFVVNGEVHDSKACTLAGLKNLNHLQGSLCIKNLGSVDSFRKISKANLQSKSKIVQLQLNFENDAEEVGMNKDDKSTMFTDDIVPEAFQPPPNLEFLEIRGYKGNTRSLDFIMSLSKLKTLNLHYCMYLDHLPPLGKLPFLKSLSISSMRCVSVGNELLGLRRDSASSSSSVIAFPSLEFLKFVNMEEWEDWDCRAEMPSLRFLSLVHCPKLKALPNQILQTRQLEELTINWCPMLEVRYNKTTYYRHDVSHIPNIMINFDYVPRFRS